jgi:hypothetical protein
MNENETTYENKCNILSEIWLGYRNDAQFQDFVEYNDLGLPLAYAIANRIVPSADKAKDFIEETFALLLAGLGIDEDTGYETMDDIMSDVE